MNFVLPSGRGEKSPRDLDTNLDLIFLKNFCFEIIINSQELGKNVQGGPVHARACICVCFLPVQFDHMCSFL